jgi:hypothetical protein
MSAICSLLGSASNAFMMSSLRGSSSNVVIMSSFAGNQPTDSSRSRSVKNRASPFTHSRPTKRRAESPLPVAAAFRSRPAARRAPGTRIGPLAPRRAVRDCVYCDRVAGDAELLDERVTEPEDFSTVGRISLSVFAILRLERRGRSHRSSTVPIFRGNCVDRNERVYSGGFCHGSPTVSYQTIARYSGVVSFPLPFAPLVRVAARQLCYPCSQGS